MSGFTRLYIDLGRSVNVVDGLLTGFHDPMANQLAMLYALADEEIVRSAYAEAVEHHYLDPAEGLKQYTYAASRGLHSLWLFAGKLF